MTTVKEFEAQKLELLNSLNELNGWCDRQDFRRLMLIRNAISNLQPPKPPTCATCEYFTGRRCDLGVTDKWLEADESFGCLHHSDYDEVKDVR